MSKADIDACLINETRTSGQSCNMNSWDVSQVTSMYYMFYGATSFNADISAAGMSSSVTGMKGMFFRASSFNADISGWDTSSVTDTSVMFT